MSYAPASSVGWLDLDTATRDRVGELLRALEEPGTLDPLGFGSVRDTVAGMLSPGTSTIQTRLRYFLFLPWIFRGMEAERISAARFPAVLRDREAQLIDCLRPLGANQGIIGRTVGRELKRMPSTVYWGGLGSWGLRRHNLSLAEYGKRAGAFGRLTDDRDDDGNPTTRTEGMWASLPEPPEGFLNDELSFALQRDEAEVLVDHITRWHPGSLIAALCRAPAAAASADLPWDLDDGLLGSPLAEIVHHARCFSELTVGPQHLYNVLLARRGRAEFGWDTSDLEESQSQLLTEWARVIADAGERHRAWVADIDAFWALLMPFDAVGEPTRRFATQIVKRAVQDPLSFGDDPEITDAICRREVRLKDKRARLGSRSALESWNGAPFGGQLNYRWPTTQSYLNDLAAALEGPA